MNYFKNSFVEVFRNKFYILLWVLVSLIFYSFNVLLPNYRLLLTNFSLIFYLIIGSYYTTTLASFISLVTISLLTGFLISLITFQMKRQIIASKATNIGFGGVVIGSLVPACSTCGLGVLSLFGFGGFFTFLPFKGLEFAAISIAVLAIAITFVSKKINTHFCETKH